MRSVEVQNASIELLEKLKQFNAMTKQHLTRESMHMDDTMIRVLTDLLVMLPPSPDTAALLAAKLQGVIEYAITAWSKTDSIGE